MAPKKDKKDAKKGGDGPSAELTDKDLLEQARLRIESLEQQLVWREEKVQKALAAQKELQDRVAHYHKDFEREKEEVFDISADMTRQYKGMREELLEIASTSWRRPPLSGRFSLHTVSSVSRVFPVVRFRSHARGFHHYHQNQMPILRPCWPRCAGSVLGSSRQHLALAPELPSIAQTATPALPLPEHTCPQRAPGPTRATISKAQPRSSQPPCELGRDVRPE